MLQPSVINVEPGCACYASRMNTKVPLLLFVVFMIGCTAEPTVVTAPTDAPPTALATPAPTDVPNTEPNTEPTTSAEATTLQPYTADDVMDVMLALSEGRQHEMNERLAQIRDADDEQFVPVLIELIRFAQLGITPWAYRPEVVQTLEHLTGQPFGYEWAAWVEWYGMTDIEPPEQFSVWKAQLLDEIDPRFSDFFDHAEDATIRVEEIMWGGVALDGIPALDNPTMIPAAEADYLDLTDPVFGVQINGDARAYPLRLLDWHEMANDVVGGQPISIAYCTLCGAAIAYDGQVNVDTDEMTFDFGSSGFLYRSNKLMYDRQTRTLWNQFTGEPVMGELVGSGIRLDYLPVVLTTWIDWQEQYPDTVVADINTGFSRNYALGAAYDGYFSDPETMFPVWQRDDALKTKDQVYVLPFNGIDGAPKAYPIELLALNRVTHDDETDTVLVSTRGIVDVIQFGGTNIGSRRTDILDSEFAHYTAGSEVRAYETAGQTFTPTDDPDVIRDQEGNEWRVTEESLMSESGEALQRMNGHLAYWFGFHAFYPDADLFEG